MTSRLRQDDTVKQLQLTLNLLTTTIVSPPSNASKWQMGFNSAFKGLSTKHCFIPIVFSYSERILCLLKNPKCEESCSLAGQGIRPCTENYKHPEQNATPLNS